MDDEQKRDAEIECAIRYLLGSMLFDLTKVDIRIRCHSQNDEFRVFVNPGLDEGYDVFDGESIQDIVSQVRIRYIRSIHSL